MSHIELFDVFRDKEKVGEGKKSYALSFIIQDTAKTLTDEQIDKVMNKMQKSFINDLGAIMR
mgnify:CR=1 FL=1